MRRYPLKQVAPREWAYGDWQLIGHVRDGKWAIDFDCDGYTGSTRFAYDDPSTAIEAAMRMANKVEDNPPRGWRQNPMSKRTNPGRGADALRSAIRQRQRRTSNPPREPMFSVPTATRIPEHDRPGHKAYRIEWRNQFGELHRAGYVDEGFLLPARYHIQVPDVVSDTFVEWIGKGTYAPELSGDFLVTDEEYWWAGKPSPRSAFVSTSGWHNPDDAIDVEPVLYFETETSDGDPLLFNEHANTDYGLMYGLGSYPDEVGDDLIIRPAVVYDGEEVFMDPFYKGVPTPESEVEENVIMRMELHSDIFLEKGVDPLRLPDFGYIIQDLAAGTEPRGSVWGEGYDSPWEGEGVRQSMRTLANYLEAQRRKAGRRAWDDVEDNPRRSRIKDALADEARKYDTFEEFEQHYWRNAGRGIFWIATRDPEFKIGPKEAEDAANGKFILYTSPFEALKGVNATKPFVAEVELLGKAQEGIDYEHIEPRPDEPDTSTSIRVINTKAASTYRVIPADKARRVHVYQRGLLPVSRQELLDAWLIARSPDSDVRRKHRRRRRTEEEEAAERELLQLRQSLNPYRSLEMNPSDSAREARRVLARYIKGS